MMKRYIKKKPYIPYIAPAMTIIDVYKRQEQYLGLKERQKRLKQEDAYTAQARYDIAVEFGRLLSYPEEGIAGLIKKAAAKQR